TDPGRQGPPLFIAPLGQGAGDLPLPRSRAWAARRTREDPRPHARSADLPGAGDEDRARCGEILFGGGKPAEEGDGDLPLKGEDRTARGENGRAHGRSRLRCRVRAALLRPDQGLRRIWLSREPCRELRAPRLRIE